MTQPRPSPKLYHIRRFRLRYMGQYFLRGVLVIAPVFLTIALLLWLFRKVDGLFSPQVTTPGLGVVCVLFAIILIGWVSSFFIVRRIFGVFGQGMEKMPGVSFIYSSLRDFFEAFVGSKKRFTHSVLVNVFAEEVWTIGFLTDEELEAFGLGATVCFRQKPTCLVCPVAAFCAARQAGDPERVPRLKPKEIEQRTVTRLWCVDQGRLLLRRGHAQAKRLAGLHELPEAADLQLKPGPQSLLATKRRAITRFQIVESIHAVAITPALRKKISAEDFLEWVALKELDDVTLSGPHKRWIAELLAKSPA